MMIDKLKFDDDVAEMVGMPAMLLMTCPRIGDAQFGMCYSMTAAEAARVIYVTGIPQFSIPMVIVSDSEPAFASEVMQELARIFGVKEWDFGPVSSPQHHAKIERRVEPYNRAIKGAMAAGIITDRRTLEVVLTSALITQTQLLVTYGSTAFTRRTGAVPRTHRELYSSTMETNVELKTKVEEDAPVLTALQFYVNELCDWHQEVRDMAHRKTLYPKLAAIAKQLGTDFYLVEGDMVSYKGEKWLLLAVPGSPNQPMTATIQQATHADAVATKVVKYDTLRPLASMREKLLYEAEVPVNKGDFVFFLMDKKKNGVNTALIVQGVITKTGVEKHEVHVYDPSPQHKCYLPAWECKGKPDKNQKKHPAKGYKAETLSFKVSDLEMVTKLTASYKIPAQAWLSLKANGIVLPLE
jgi:hypothetical protein